MTRPLFTAVVCIAVLILAACAGTAVDETEEPMLAAADEAVDEAADEVSDIEEVSVTGDNVDTIEVSDSGKTAESEKPVDSEPLPDDIDDAEVQAESVESLTPEIEETAVDEFLQPADTEVEESTIEKEVVPEEAVTNDAETKEAETKETETQETETQETETQETETPPNPLLVEDRPYSETKAPPVAAVVSDTIEPSKTADMATAEPEEQALDDPAVSAASPSRLLEGPGEFTITLEGLGWIFRSDRSTPGSWRFLERELDGNSTHFRFMFTETGNWNLVFERQDLSSGGSENVVRTVMVGEDDGRPRIDNGPIPEFSENPIPGTMPMDAEARNEAAIIAADEGHFGEAIEYWEQDASRNDEAGRRARASLMKNAARSGSIGPLITWLPKYIEDGPDPDILALVLEVFDEQAGYDSQSLLILEELTASGEGIRRAEWLYRLASYLEKPGEDRDLDRSAALYQNVINGWPLTEWRDLSEERLLWLQRHYFRIR